jgi:hypothetical protein
VVHHPSDQEVLKYASAAACGRCDLPVPDRINSVLRHIMLDLWRDGVYYMSVGAWSAMSKMALGWGVLSIG